MVKKLFYFPNFLNMSPARLMIKTWEFSHHVHHFPPANLSCCNCQEYLNLCIDTAREGWDNENFIFLIVHCIGFSIIEKNLMSLKNEEYKEQLIESILR